MQVYQSAFITFSFLSKLFGWQIEKYDINQSSVRKALLYGEKVAKIGPVYTEIFDYIRQFFGHVVLDVHK